jgi:hypothetical protein
MFVGRGFSRDIKVFVSSGVLTPEGFRAAFSAAWEACLTRTERDTINSGEIP